MRGDTPLKIRGARGVMKESSLIFRGIMEKLNYHRNYVVNYILAHGNFSHTGGMGRSWAGSGTSGISGV